MRKFLLILLWCVSFSGFATPIEESISFNRVYNLFKDYPSETLDERGMNYIDKGSLDSALVCFTIISNRYLANMSVPEQQRCARAYNKSGAIYLMHYYNYSKGYANLLRALEICEMSGYNSFIPTVNSNIASIFLHYGDYEKAYEFIEKSYDQSLKAEDWDGVVVFFLI